MAAVVRKKFHSFYILGNYLKLIEKNGFIDASNVQLFCSQYS